MKFDFSGKKVFITGADGFIGSHLVESLVLSGAKVTALVYYNSWNYLGWLTDANNEVIDAIEIIKGDVRDANFISDSIRGTNYVFHLSSLIGIPYSYVAPQSYIDTNVGGTLNVLQASMQLDSLDKLVHVSTSEVYGSAQELPMNEQHPLVGQSPYSASKIAADKIVESFNLSFGLPSVTARPFNTYGPRQTARAVIPTIISQVIDLDNHKLTLGNLDSKRDFNYVDDTVNGMLALASCEETMGEAVNIGSGENWSIKEVVDLVFDITGRTIEISQDHTRIRPENSEVNELLCDNSKLLDLTEWKSETDLKTGLKTTIDWMEENQKKFSIDNYDI